MLYVIKYERLHVRSIYIMTIANTSAKKIASKNIIHRIPCFLFERYSDLHVQSFATELRHSHLPLAVVIQGWLVITPLGHPLVGLYNHITFKTVIPNIDFIMK